MSNGKNGPPTNGRRPPKRTTKRPTGRPPVLDEVVISIAADGGQVKEIVQTRQQLVIAALDNGCGLHDAFRFAGINSRTGDDLMRTGRHARERWLTTGRPDKPVATDARNADFLVAVESAQAQVKVRLVKVMMDAALKHPRWAAWLLAHLDPRQYGATITLKTERDDVIRDAEKVAGLLDVAAQPVIEEAIRIYEGAGGTEL